MVGRFALEALPEEVAGLFGLAAIDGFPPRPAILPTQPILVVIAGSEGRFDASHTGRAAMLVRWGLIPGWFRGEDALPALFNARAETAAENAAFRGALRHRRCLVPASSFFRKTGRGGRDAKARGGQLDRFFLPGEPVFAMAALMESYMAPDGSEIDTAAILTAPARLPDLDVIDRLPVIISKDGVSRWLDCRSHGPGDIADLLVAPDLSSLAIDASL
ncbi:SOS response-associated peptidase [Jiella mangrovi]|uniref:Abasic site processing protein n=1 Tax=Jiella mangrovi TaxID=2821407 RepID=A0ABS4BBZ3_9HYPH|nr:SOS response-associated peptidase [Jiella mangrovi]